MLSTGFLLGGCLHTGDITASEAPHAGIAADGVFSVGRHDIAKAVVAKHIQIADDCPIFTDRLDLLIDQYAAATADGQTCALDNPVGSGTGVVEFSCSCFIGGFNVLSGSPAAASPWARDATFHAQPRDCT